MTLPKIQIDQKNKEIKIQNAQNWKVLYDCSDMDLKIKCKKFDVEADESITLNTKDCEGMIYINTTEEMEREWQASNEDFLEYFKLGEEKYRQKYGELFLKKLEEFKNASSS